MKPLTAAEIAVLSGALLVRGPAATVLTAVTTDSRAVPESSLFVALRGQNFDGHDFLAPAVAAGAGAVLVERPEAVPASAVAVLAAPDAVAALQRLAAGYRKLLAPRVVAVTGSNGKTTCKDFTSAVLSVRHSVQATAGNLNNHLGLPLTMLAHEPGQTHGVYELGSNHPGEIAALAALARPDIAVVTSVGTAHIEFFGSVEAIADEKASLFAALRPEGVAVLNLESPWAERCRTKAPGRVVEVGIGRGTVRAEEVTFNEAGLAWFTIRAEGASARVVMPVPGAHMIQNALLALAVGWIEGVPLEEGASALAAAGLSQGRLQRRQWRGVSIWDDSYNGNPDSMTAAIEALAAAAADGRRIAVLGGMAELGKFEAEGHRRVGRAAAGAQLDLVCTVGPDGAPIAAAAEAGGVAVRTFETHRECAAWLAGELRPGDLVLLKGSRRAAMEKVLSCLEEVSA